MLLIGGRVVPFFTKNYVQDPQIRKWPWMDWAGLASAGLYVAVVFVVGEHHLATGISATIAGFANALRMRHWGSWQTLRTPILWILHLAFLWIVAGFFMHAAVTWGWLPWSAAVHAFTVGGMGCFILGMVSRVALGHTGRSLQVAPIIVVAYGLLALTALLRVLLPLLPGGWFHHLIGLTGLGWTIAFSIYVGVYTPILIQPRADGREG